MNKITSQKACRIAKQLLMTAYGDYFRYTPAELRASHVGTRTYKRREILTVDVKELYIEMQPVKVDLWRSRGRIYGEIALNSPHYDFLEPSFTKQAVYDGAHWSPVMTGDELFAQYEKADVPVREAGKAAKRFLVSVSGRKDWHVRHIKEKVGRYPKFQAYTRDNSAKGSPKVTIVVKEGFQVLIVGYSNSAYPSIMKGIKAEKKRKKKRESKKLKRAVATATAKAYVAKSLGVGRKRLKGKSGQSSKDGKSMTVSVYLDGGPYPYVVRVKKGKGGLTSEFVKVGCPIVIL